MLLRRALEIGRRRHRSSTVQPSSVRTPRIGRRGAMRSTSRPSTIETSATPAERATAGRELRDHARRAPCPPRSSRRCRADRARTPPPRVEHAWRRSGDNQACAPRRRAPDAAAIRSAFTLRSVPSAVDAEARDHRNVAERQQIASSAARSGSGCRRDRDRRSAHARRSAGALRRGRAASAPVSPTARHARGDEGRDEAVLMPPASTATTASSVSRVGHAQPVDERAASCPRPAARRRSPGRRRARRRADRCGERGQRRRRACSRPGPRAARRRA